MSNTILKNKVINQFILDNLEADNECIAPHIFNNIFSLDAENQNYTLTFPNIIKYIGYGAFSNLNINSDYNFVLNSNLKALAHHSFSQDKSFKGKLSIQLNDGLEFIGNYALYNTKYPNTITLPDSIIYVGENSFSESDYSTRRITSVIWSSNCHIIPFGCFRYSTNLQTITNTDNVIAIASEAFTGCTRLTLVSLANLRAISGSHVFYDCSNLKTITFGPNLTYISDNSTFSGCSKLTTINVMGDENCITAKCLQSLGPSRYNNATIVYNYTPPESE